VLAAAEAALDPALDVDYLTLRAPDLGAVADHGPARLLGAVRAGKTRLIDNVEVIL
jgi:pantoate--beta-alanine ligase